MRERKGITMSTNLQSNHELELTDQDLADIKLFVRVISDEINVTAISLACFYDASPEAPALFKKAVEDITEACSVYRNSVPNPECIIDVALALYAVRKRVAHSLLFPSEDLISIKLVEKIVRMYFD